MNKLKDHIAEFSKIAEAPHRRHRRMKMNSVTHTLTHQNSLNTHIAALE